jgi:hypothetical protein
MTDPPYSLPQVAARVFALRREQWDQTEFAELSIEDQVRVQVAEIVDSGSWALNSVCVTADTALEALIQIGRMRRSTLEWIALAAAAGSLYVDHAIDDEPHELSDAYGLWLRALEEGGGD